MHPGLPFCPSPDAVRKLYHGLLRKRATPIRKRGLCWRWLWSSGMIGFSIKEFFNDHPPHSDDVQCRSHYDWWLQTGEFRAAAPRQCSAGRHTPAGAGTLFIAAVCVAAESRTGPAPLWIFFDEELKHNKWPHCSEVCLFEMRKNQNHPTNSRAVKRALTWLYWSMVIHIPTKEWTPWTNTLKWPCRTWWCNHNLRGRTWHH